LPFISDPNEDAVAVESGRWCNGGWLCEFGVGIAMRKVIRTGVVVGSWIAEDNGVGEAGIWEE